MTNTKIQIVNDYVLLAPDSVTVVHGGMYDHLLYKDWEINTCEEGGFYVIDCNDEEYFSTLEDAMKFIDSRVGDFN